MSIHVMSSVWKNSRQKANKLLMLLAIADNANDDGWAYPSVQTLAEKVRVSKRNAQKILDSLEADKEIVIWNCKVSKKTLLHSSNAYHMPKYGVEDAQPPTELRRYHMTMRSNVARDITPVVMSPETLRNVARDTRVMSPETSESSFNHQLTTKKEKDSDIELKSTSESTQENQQTNSKKNDEPPQPKVVGSIEPPKNPQTPNSARPLSPKKAAQNAMHAALLVEFGLNPDTMTKTADSLYWSVAAELWQFPLERIHELYLYVKRKAQVEQWNSFGVKALAKYAPEFLRDHPVSKITRISEPEPLAVAAGAENMQRITPEQIAEMDRIEAELVRKFGLNGGR